jgi:hypothetical protein
LGPRYFDGSRNLKVSDAKALLTAAETLKDRKSASLAKKLIERFERKRDKAKAAKAATGKLKSPGCGPGLGYE